MLSESVDLAIIPLSFGVTGIVFLCIAIFLNWKYGYKQKGTRTTGTLIGFRRFEDYNINAVRIITNNIKYRDYSYNARNSKPIISFYIDGREVEQYTEWSVTDLDKKDIGSRVPIKYFLSNGGKTCRVILEGGQYSRQRDRGRKIIFWIFAGIGFAMIALTLLVLLLYYLYL